jgi:hypothetical protein
MHSSVRKHNSMISVNITARGCIGHRFSFDLSNEDEFVEIALKNGTYRTRPHYNDGSVTVMATGKSLEKIKEMFTNLPMADLQTVTWSGEHATFILENLRTYAFELTRNSEQVAPC